MYEIGDLVKNRLLCGIIIKKETMIDFKAVVYLVDFFSKDEVEPRYMLENELFPLTQK
jgi:hypothetical protein